MLAITGSRYRLLSGTVNQRDAFSARARINQWWQIAEGDLAGVTYSWTGSEWEVVIQHHSIEISGLPTPGALQTSLTNGGATVDVADDGSITVTGLLGAEVKLGTDGIVELSAGNHARQIIIDPTGGITITDGANIISLVDNDGIVITNSGGGKVTLGYEGGGTFIEIDNNTDNVLISAGAELRLKSDGSGIVLETGGFNPEVTSVGTDIGGGALSNFETIVPATPPVVPVAGTAADLITALQGLGLINEA